MWRYKRLLPYAFREWRILLCIVSLTAVSSLAAALQPWPLKLLVDSGFGSVRFPEPLRFLISRQPTTGDIIWISALASLTLFFVSSLVTASLTWAWSVGGQHMVRNLAADLFSRLQRLSLETYSRRPTGDLLSRLTTDTWCMYKLTDGALIAPAHKIFTIAAVGILAWSLNRELAIYSLISAPFLGLVSYVLGKRMRQRARLAREAQSKLASFVHQTLSAIHVVQSFTLEERNRQRFLRLAGEATRISKLGAALTSVYGLATGFVTTAGTALVVYLGGRAALRGTLSVGSLLVFLAYMRTLQTTAESMFTLYGNLKPLEASMDRILEIFDSNPEGVHNVSRPQILPALRSGTGREVSFQNVTFGYRPNCPVLTRIEFDARAGETIALIGPSGAGKTTLVSLIPRFYDPQEGCVLFDGFNIQQAELGSLRSQIAIVPQNSYLFPLTIAENIAYGRLDAPREDIIRAAQDAGADVFIQRLSKGYDTVVGERGATLSGGERQRVALARAFLKNAPILILDEPSSALDAETEHLLLQALERLVEGRTTFIIAHRHSTLRIADRIVVLDEGRIIATGTEQQLMTTCDIYRRHHSLQFEATGRETVMA